MAKNFKLGFDIGGSELRVVSNDKTLVRRHSGFKELSKSTFIVQDTNAYELVDIMFELNGTETIEKRVVIGKSANFYSEMEANIYNDKLKTQTDELFINIALGVYGYMLETNTFGKTVNISIDEIIIALPPIEVYSQAVNTFKEKLSNSKLTISTPLLAADGNSAHKPKIKIKDVKCIAEGIAAMLSLSEEEQELIDSNYSLIIDSGKRSTDVELMKDGSIVKGGIDTFQISGIQLESFIKADLRRMGKEIDTDDCVEIIKTGMYHNKEDYSTILFNAKQKYVDSLYSHLISFCNALPFNINTIENIVLFGRVYDDANLGSDFKSLLQEKFPTKNIIVKSEATRNIDGVASLLGDE